MKISEFTQTEYVGETGIKWTYRQPGVALANEVQQMFTSAMSGDSIRKAVKGEASDGDGLDYQAALRLQSEAALLAFRVCTLGVTGLEAEDGAPFDLSALRTDTVDLCGVPMKAMTMAGLESLDTGPIGDDIRALGGLIVAACKMGGAQKKT